MHDVNRIQYVTRNYNRLLGLCSVPLGVLFLVEAVVRAGWFPLPEWLEVIGTILGALLAGALVLPISSYYERRFGNVQMLEQDTDRWINAFGVLFFIATGVLILDGVLNLPVSLLCLALATFLLVFWWQGSRFAWHYVLMALLVAGIGLLPLFTDISTREFIMNGGSGLVLGTIFIAGGLFDHLLLARTLKPVPEE